MESSIERISAVECRVKVEIPWQDISKRLNNKMRDLRRQARLPGFRPGKVPPQVLERMFGKGVRQELAGEVVQETFQDAVQKHDTTPLTQPVLESSSLEKGQPFTYEARFEVPPVIEPKDYTEVPVRRRPAVAAEDKVNAELDKKREDLVELHPLPEDNEREITQPLDVWTIDVDGQFAGQKVVRKDFQVEIGSTKDELIPGLAAALFDTRLDQVGSVRNIRFTPPSDRVRDEFKGKEAVLQVGLREVKVKVVPEFDDDFARDTGEAETMEELRKMVEDKVREADAEEAEREARRRLVVSLLERNEFEPAPSMVAREVSAQVEQTKRQLANQGLRLSAIGTTEAQLAQRIRPQAVFNVKAYLLLDSIGKTESIDVSDEDFEKELADMAEQSGQNVGRMKATMEKNGQIVLLRAQMREERILDFLMGKAEITEAEDPPEEQEQDEEQAPGHQDPDPDAPQSFDITLGDGSDQAADAESSEGSDSAAQAAAVPAESKDADEVKAEAAEGGDSESGEGGESESADAEAAKSE